MSRKMKNNALIVRRDNRLYLIDEYRQSIYYIPPASVTTPGKEMRCIKTKMSSVLSDEEILFFIEDCEQFMKSNQKRREEQIANRKFNFTHLN